ncbi:ABC transporter permease [Halolamina rubra]|uniref:ABC transporter permease n=1 Tax=Halolamina rubra TaxID=1380430 RepID=UPI000679C1B8|nr:ABC transporter permease [Halolamina rubra]
MSVVEDEDATLRERLADEPAPALRVLAVVAALVAVEFGALASLVMSLPWEAVGAALPGFLQGVAATLAGVGDALAGLPTLLSRDVIPNGGYQLPSGEWENTFLGLSPAAAWLLRVALIYAYGFVWLLVGWWSYLVYRDNYRHADWAPVDDMVGRFRNHSWGLFGLAIIFSFVVLAVFAPALGPTTVEANIADPYLHSVEYFSEETGSVEEIYVGDANGESQSRGQGGENVGPLSYDQYDRFHPFGTLPSGKDLFTFMAAGARVSLFIGVLSLVLAGGAAVVFALATAYYKGLVDLGIVITSDSIQAMPQLLVIMLASFVLSGTWLANLYNGGLVLALLFGLTGWPGLWRAVRGPALQVSEREWVDAAKSFGQRPSVTMRKHMLPYVVGYLLIYASLTLGGVIIGVAGLSFLGLGINAPTPEWGRAVSAGQPYVATPSWHISLLPGILIVIVVTGFNALGDGIRDAIDPQSDVDTGQQDQTAAAGGGA